MMRAREALAALFSADLVRFAVVGVGATLVHGVGLIVLTPLVGAELLANALAVAASAQVSYFGHKAFTFRSDAPHRVALPKFIVQTGFAWLYSSAVVAALGGVLGVKWTALIIMATLPPLSFVVFKYWTFAPTPADAKSKLSAD